MEKKSPAKKPADPKSTSKKTPQKPISKSSPRKKAAQNTGLEALADELSGLIPQLDEEGLSFLVQQARIHLYNMRAEALNQNILRENQREKEKTQKKARTATAGLTIRAGNSGNSFYLEYGNDWVMLTDTEMIQLAKIASGPGSEEERAERVFRWIERERQDIFGLIPIENRLSPALAELVRLITKNFKVRYGES